MNIRKPNVTDHYLRYKEINDYFDYLEHRYCHLVTIFPIGRSFEGRPLKAIKIDLYKGKKSNERHQESNRQQQDIRNKLIHKTNKNWVIIEAGTHAREWITISFALYCIYQLTEKNFRNRDILCKLRFIIVPLVNPDGYEYSHEKNPLWRKNRRPIPNCNYIGTDCNRNYDIHWEKGCSKTNKSTYCGDAPFSEPETCALKNLMEKLSTNIKFFLSLHSYAETIMYPWGYTKELPQKWKQLHDLADCARKAIQKSTGRIYSCGSISKLTRKIYSGSVVDYAYGVQKVPFVLVMELPGKKFGFHPPTDKIKSILIESWTGVKAMCQNIIDNNFS